jgi:hypothetical protein
MCPKESILGEMGLKTLLGFRTSENEYQGKCKSRCIQAHHVGFLFCVPCCGLSAIQRRIFAYKDGALDAFFSFARSQKNLNFAYGPLRIPNYNAEMS